MAKGKLMSTVLIFCIFYGINCDAVIYTCGAGVLWKISRGYYNRVYEKAFPCPNRNNLGGQCVALAKCLCGAPNTRQWSPGIKIQDYCAAGRSGIARGTVIATFSDGHYINDGTGHTAVFKNCVSRRCIQVYDQWCGVKPYVRTYCDTWWKYQKFYVVECRNQPCTQAPWCQIDL